MDFEFEEMELVRKDNGKKIYCKKCSCRESDSRKNLLLVHGLTFSSHVFDIDYKDYSMVRYFAKKGYTVWRIDIGGYGLSDKYEDGFEVDTENASVDILTALEVICGLQKTANADILAWSWGTMTAAKAAERRPELVRRMVWLGPCFGGTLPVVEVTRPFTTLSYANLARVFQRESGSNVEVDYHITEAVVVGIWYRQAFQYDIGHGRPNGGNREIMGCGDHWLIDVERVPMPVAILAGTKDSYVLRERAKSAFARLPEGSECHFFEGAGHAAWIEKDSYRAVRERALAFLEK